MFDAIELLNSARPNEVINYHKMLLKVIDMWKSHKDRPKVILHSCCAPCSTSVSYTHLTLPTKA